MLAFVCPCLPIRRVVGHCLVFSFSPRLITLRGKEVQYPMFFLVTVQIWCIKP